MLFKQNGAIPAETHKTKLTIQAPPFAVKGWGSCYSAEWSRAMAWISVSHSSAKPYSHWAVACLGRANQGVCPGTRPENLCGCGNVQSKKLLFLRWCFICRLQVLVGCIPSEGSFPDHKMSRFVFACCFTLSINLLFWLFFTDLHEPWSYPLQRPHNKSGHLQHGSYHYSYANWHPALGEQISSFCISILPLYCKCP